MSLALDATATARIAASVRGVAWLVDLEFDSGTIYFTTSPVSLTVSGHDYLGLGDLASVSPLGESEDANAEKIVAIVPINSYSDIGGSKVARPSFDPIDFEVSGGTLYIGAINGSGTPTYTAASDLRVKLTISLHNVNK